MQWILPHHVRSEHSDSMSPKDSFSSDIQSPLLRHEDSEPEISMRSSLQRLLRTTRSSTIHNFWRKFDDSYMRPMFGGRGFVPHLPRVVTVDTLIESQVMDRS